MAGVLDIPHASYNNVTEDNQSGLVNGHAGPGQGNYIGQDPALHCLEPLVPEVERHDQWTC